MRHNIDALLNQQLRTTLRLCIAKFAARPTVGAAPAQLLADLYNREIGVVRLILSFVGPNQDNYDDTWMFQALLRMQLSHSAEDLTIETQQAVIAAQAETMATTIKKQAETIESQQRTIEALVGGCDGAKPARKRKK